MTLNLKTIAIASSVLGAVVLSALLVTKGLSSTKKASAVPRKRTDSGATRDVSDVAPTARQAAIPASLVLIGDSQTAGALGDAYVQAFDQTDVRFFGKPGATHEDYVRDPALRSELRRLGCADVVVVQLGDNGVSNSQSAVEDFVELLRSQCPDSQIIWAGPMKAVAPTNGSSTYVNTSDPSSKRYLPVYNETRRTWDARLNDWLPALGVTYFSNYALQEQQPLSSAFSDSRDGDGIHLSSASAARLAELMRDFIYFDLED
jgi:lysophospholipase L1-like esterase